MKREKKKARSSETKETLGCDSPQFVRFDFVDSKMTLKHFTLIEVFQLFYSTSIYTDYSIITGGVYRIHNWTNIGTIY